MVGFNLFLVVVLSALVCGSMGQLPAPGYLTNPSGVSEKPPVEVANRDYHDSQAADITSDLHAVLAAEGKKNSQAQNTGRRRKHALTSLVSFCLRSCETGSHP